MKAKRPRSMLTQRMLVTAMFTQCVPPLGALERPVSSPTRMPISGIYKIKGIGDVLAGRVKQGVVKPSE
eukprot:3386753-Karenia_brevis.AAC.1